MFYNGLNYAPYPAVHKAFFTYKLLGFSNYQMQAVLTAAASLIVFSLSCSATTETFLRPRECDNYAWYNLILTMFNMSTKEHRRVKLAYLKNKGVIIIASSLQF